MERGQKSGRCYSDDWNTVLCAARSQKAAALTGKRQQRPLPLSLRRLRGILTWLLVSVGETEHLLPVLCTWGWLWTNKDTRSLCVVPRKASYQSQSCPSCQRRAWTRLSGRRCPRNTQSGCSSSVWPEWRRWQTRCPESSPAARRTAERWGYVGAHLPIHRR